MYRKFFGSIHRLYSFQPCFQNSMTLCIVKGIICNRSIALLFGTKILAWLQVYKRSSDVCLGLNEDLQGLLGSPGVSCFSYILSKMHPGFKVEDRHKKDVSPDLGFCSIHPVNDDRADISSYEVYKILYFTPKLKTDTARYGTFGMPRPENRWHWNISSRARFEQRRGLERVYSPKDIMCF